MYKKPGDIIPLCMCTINEDHMINASWDIRHDKQSFLLFLIIFCPLTFLTKFWNKKNPWRYYHFTLAYHKWWSYDVWFLRYWGQQTEFLVILYYFLPFYPLNNPENQNFVKMKKMPIDIIILHMYTINENNMM